MNRRQVREEQNMPFTKALLDVIKLFKEKDKISRVSMIITALLISKPNGIL